MSDAQEIIRLYDMAESDAMNFRRLYQDSADLCFPRENSIITTFTTQGGERNTDIIDPTGIMAKDDMAAGLSGVLFPVGQPFHEILMVDRELNRTESVRRYLGYLNETVHEKRAASNFRVQADETLRSIAAFGTGNLFSEYRPGVGLNYKDWDVGQYVIVQNNMNRIDQVYMKIWWTASQAYAEWGDKVGEEVLKALNDDKKMMHKFEFRVAIRPRGKRNRRLSDAANMPFEKVCVNVKEKIVVEEGGYEEFPHFVSRWSHSSNETWGRGQGVTALPVMRRLQQIYSDFLECGEKHNNPALQVLQDFDGTVKVKPGAVNRVPQLPSIDSVGRALGNFPITAEVLDGERQIVQKMFLNDIFMPITPLKGDRRNQLELSERISESMKRIGTPISRLYEEWIKPMVIRDIFLLMRNGELPPPPPEIRGKQFKINVLGPIAMQLKNWQAQGALKWLGYGAELKQSFPGIDDNINLDSAYRRVGESLGVSIEDMATDDEVNAKRAERAKQIQAEQAMRMAETAAKAYPASTKAPEAGSPAEALSGV